MNIKNEFAENITDTSKLTRQKLGNFVKAKILTAQYQAVRIFFWVRLIGLEPTRRETPDPKSGASTNFATGALL